MAAALREADARIEELTAFVEGWHSTECRKYAVKTGRWEFCTSECADSRRSLLTDPEPSGVAVQETTEGANDE